MVNVLGLGYIGLPTALMLSSRSIAVVGSDIKESVVENLNSNNMVFKEKGMEELFNSALKNGISFITEVIPSETYIIAVPTPYDNKSKSVDPKFVIQAITRILSVSLDNAIIIIESTISPGTIDKYVRPILAKSTKRTHIVHAPERIIPGNMIKELKNNSRVIGADDREIGEKVKKIYSAFCDGEIIITDIKTAEMTKVVENTYRDINIAFANELAQICRKENLDVYEVIDIANMHPRVNVLKPGPGVGGHCISVDPWFLVGDYPELANLVKTARETNDNMPIYVYERIKTIMKENNIDSFDRVGLYGLTYKEDVDDIRESPTLQLLKILDGDKKVAKVYDPFIKEKLYLGQEDNFKKFLNSIEMIVIMVGHTHIKEELNLLNDKIIFDTRNVILTKDKLYKL